MTAIHNEHPKESEMSYKTINVVRTGTGAEIYSLSPNVALGTLYNAEPTFHSVQNAAFTAQQLAEISAEMMRMHGDK
jgi:hypothetical protein